MKMNVCLMYLITITAAILSVVTSEKCGYVRGPLAITNDTIIISLDCKQSSPLSRAVPLQIPDNATHVAVQLLHCPTVPVGLFTNVTGNLKSVTVASEDAVQLLEGTFSGLEHVSEFRLLGFTILNHVSTAVLKPLRNIQTLILDGFGFANDELRVSVVGSVIQQLSGTPIRRLVLNKIKTYSFWLYPYLNVDEFRIANASVKELIITDGPLSYVGSIRQAFPDLVCFCGGGRLDKETAVSILPLVELTALSDKLKEVVLYRPNDFQIGPVQITSFLASSTQLRTFEDILDYSTHQSKKIGSEDCYYGLIFKLGAKLSKVIANNFPLSRNTEKKICIQDDNNLTYLDLTGVHVQETVPVVTGLKKLRYLSLENTGIKRLSEAFSSYNYSLFPAVKVLKLSRNDLGAFIKNVDGVGNYSGLFPTLIDISLDHCNITKFPDVIFPAPCNLENIDLSNNKLRTIDLDLQNCPKLIILNLRHNNIESITESRITEITRLSLRKKRGHSLIIDLSYNKFHCLCNSTHFVKWLQRSLNFAHSNIKFPGFNNYTCLYPNGSIVRVSEVVVSELEQQCSVVYSLVNASDCPCDEEQRRRLSDVWVSLDGFVCRNDMGDIVPMKIKPFPNCFNPYLRASFIAPVVIGGILGITVLITVGLLIYYRNSKPVRQVRECLELYPVHFVRTALQYVMLRNHEEEHTEFKYDIMVFVQDDDQRYIHNHFREALHGNRSFITRDDFMPGASAVDAMVECIRVCRWIVPVLTANFLSDPLCTDFISRVQFSRPHALIPVIWEQLVDEPEVVSMVELLRTGDPLYWPGDQADPENKRNFWSSLLEKTRPNPT